MQTVQELLDSTIAAHSSSLEEAVMAAKDTDVECSRKQATVSVCHAQTQVKLSPEMNHQGKKSGIKENSMNIVFAWFRNSNRSRARSVSYWCAV